MPYNSTRGVPSTKLGEAVNECTFLAVVFVLRRDAGLRPAGKHLPKGRRCPAPRKKQEEASCFSDMREEERFGQGEAAARNVLCRNIPFSMK